MRGLPGITAVIVATATRDRWTTFLALFVAEALAWAGVPAVGAAALGAAGVLAGQGELHLWAVLVVGTIGAEIGGLVGWQIGNRVARAGLDRPGRVAERRAKALESGEHFAGRWGRLVVFFVPSWVSGALGMPFRQFALWNILAAGLWTLCAGLGAYGVTSAASGKSLLNSLLPILIAVAALATIVATFVYWKRRRTRGQLPAAEEPA
jgi:membrane-associated protein